MDVVLGLPKHESGRSESLSDAHSISGGCAKSALSQGCWTTRKWSSECWIPHHGAVGWDAMNKSF
eukprot:6491323-Amphidinium_carterae.4